jgi:hypothetical protein
MPLYDRLGPFAGLRNFIGIERFGCALKPSDLRVGVGFHPDFDRGGHRSRTNRVELMLYLPNSFCRDPADSADRFLGRRAILAWASLSKVVCHSWRGRTVSANREPLRASEPAVKTAGEQLNLQRWIIALSIMLGTILDTTIVNVSLPHMQGSFSASVDEITWIVTSYVVANGAMIPMTGWISCSIGRKRYFLMSVTGFVIVFNGLAA